MSLCYLYISFFKALCPLILLSVDSVDGSGSVPGDAAGGWAVSSAGLCAPCCLHYHGRGYLRSTRTDGDYKKHCQCHACGHAHTVSTRILNVIHVFNYSQPLSYYVSGKYHVWVLEVHMLTEELCAVCLKLAPFCHMSFNSICLCISMYISLYILLYIFYCVFQSLNSNLKSVKIFVLI